MENTSVKIKARDRQDARKRQETAHAGDDRSFRCAVKGHRTLAAPLQRMLICIGQREGTSCVACAGAGRAMLGKGMH